MYAQILDTLTNEDIALYYHARSHVVERDYFEKRFGQSSSMFDTYRLSVIKLLYNRLRSKHKLEETNLLLAVARYLCYHIYQIEPETPYNPISGLSFEDDDTIEDLFERYKSTQFSDLVIRSPLAYCDLIIYNTEVPQDVNKNELINICRACIEAWLVIDTVSDKFSMLDMASVIVDLSFVCKDMDPIAVTTFCHSYKRASYAKDTVIKAVSEYLDLKFDDEILSEVYFELLDSQSGLDLDNISIKKKIASNDKSFYDRESHNIRLIEDHKYVHVKSINRYIKVAKTRDSNGSTKFVIKSDGNKYIMNELAEAIFYDKFSSDVSAGAEFVGNAYKVTSDTLYIEYLEFDLQEFKKTRYINEISHSYIIGQLISAIKYLHSNMMIHCDIKPQNIIISREGYLKLIDYDVSIIKVYPGQRFQYRTQTLGYMAPEVMLEDDWYDDGDDDLENTGWDEKIDIWSLGVIAHELYTGKSPILDVYEDLVHLDHFAKNVRILNRSPSFVKECLTINQFDRPDILTIQQMFLDQQ